MATAPFLNPELKIISLADADLGGLEQLFDEQCSEWLSCLRWDYTGPSRLVREVARQRELEGVAALDEGRIVGFAFYVVEQSRCSIGDIYVSKEWRGLGADRQMAAAVLRRLEQLPGLKRIESQCVGMGNQAAQALFEDYGFQHYERLFMSAQMKTVEPSDLHEGSNKRGHKRDLPVRPWEERDFSGAARVIHQSHRHEYDSRINNQYRSEEGCIELLSILTDSIWCGNFLPAVSHVAVDSATGRLVGVLIASRLAVRAGHFGQVSVTPSYQGRGIGRRLMNAAMDGLRGLGFESVSLAVTSLNKPAVHLYESCGFRTVHKFPVFYLERH